MNEYQAFQIRITQAVTAMQEQIHNLQEQARVLTSSLLVNLETLRALEARFNEMERRNRPE